MISAFVVGFVALTVTQSVPSSTMRAWFSPVDPYGRAAGLLQSWSMFAPPPTYRFTVEAEISYADGSVRRWSFPELAKAVGSGSDARWDKLAENLRQDRNRFLWRPAAAYLAREEERHGRRPTRVAFIRNWQELLPPGPGPDRGPWQSFSFFSMPVASTGSGR